jgi:hypothetical protein
VKLTLMSIFAAGLLMAGDLPQPLGFERYTSLVNKQLFGESNQISPTPSGVWILDIKNFRPAFERQLTPLGEPIPEDGIMYPVLPPRRPKQ